MKALLFHFMNALRVPIMFATKLMLWVLIPLTLLSWSEYLGATEIGIWAEMLKNEHLGANILVSIFWAGIYYFRWKYDVLLIALRPADAQVMGVVKDGTGIAGKN